MCIYITKYIYIQCTYYVYINIQCTYYVYIYIIVHTSTYYKLVLYTVTLLPSVREFVPLKSPLIYMWNTLY